MSVLRKILIGLGSIVVVALVLALVSPKSMRAAVSTLVTVSNSLANPVLTEPATSTATQIVALYCNLSSAPGAGLLGCQLVMPGGGLGSSSYIVPAGQNLVITDVEIDSPGGGGIQFVGLQPTAAAQLAPSGNATPIWYFSNDGQTHEYQLGPGFVWPGGNPIFLNGLIGATVILRGYLTAQ
jgi:hypothetical protein